LSHSPCDLLIDFGPDADQSYRAFLKTRYETISDLSKRYTGVATGLHSWDQVRVPELASFLGWGPDAVDLSGTWKISYDASFESASAAVHLDDSKWPTIVFHVSTEDTRVRGVLVNGRWIPRTNPYMGATADFNITPFVRHGQENELILVTVECVVRDVAIHSYEKGENKPGQPPTSEEITQLVLRMARENPGWGYDRIVGAPANLGHRISDQTVGNILKAQGIEPAPARKRQTTWKTFLQLHWDVLGKIDFTTIEVWTTGGLVTFYLLLVMEIVTRRVHFAGCTPNPDDLWMMQIARNVTDAEDGFLQGKRYVLMDRDGKFSPAFQAIWKTEGVDAVLLPAKSPNLNAHLEHLHRSRKEKCLE
jgi:hypothetical protein